MALGAIFADLFRGARGTARQLTSPQDAYGGFLRAPDLSGSFTNNLPISLNFQTLSGKKAWHFEDDFYAAIYFIPNKIELESVAAATSVTLRVWNAFLTPKTLTAFNTSGDPGVTVSGPAAPLVLGALTTYTYTVNISPAGPPELNAAVNFTVTGLGPLSVPVVGTRATQFFFKPNWRTPLRRQYAFMTEIATGRTRRERRRQIRNAPRIRFEYTHSAITEDRLRLERFLTDRPDRKVVTPDWSARAVTTVDAALGATTLTVKRVPLWLVPGVTAFICDSRYNNPAIVTVNSITGLVLTLSGGLPSAYGNGALLHKSESARVDLTIQRRRLTNTVSEVEFRLAIDPGTEEVQAGTVGTIFQGREVFPFNPNWVGTPTVVYDHERIAFDVGRGRIQTNSFALHTTETFEYSFTGCTAEQIEQMEAFFIRHAGRLSEFWIQSHAPDMTVQANISAAQNFMTVEKDIADKYGDSVDHRAVEITLNDGTILRRAIVSNTVNGTNDGAELLFTQTFPSAIPASSIRKVSWLYVARFASDELVVELLTDSLANISMAATTLEVEPAE